MTDEDAQTIARLIGFADGACRNCVDDLIEQANRLLPDFHFEMLEGKSIRETYQNIYDMETYKDRIPVGVTRLKKG